MGTKTERLVAEIEPLFRRHQEFGPNGDNEVIHVEFDDALCKMVEVFARHSGSVAIQRMVTEMMNRRSETELWFA